jgi:hypothetical protein
MKKPIVFLLGTITLNALFLNLAWAEELPAMLGETATTTSVETTTTEEETSVETSSETELTTETAETEKPAFEDFDDVPVNHPYYNAVIVLRYQGILNGYPDNTFRPEQPLNRVEALKLIFEVADIPLTNGIAQASFSDTETNAWYSGYLNKATYLEVVAGYPDGSFRPSDPVNAVEFLKMLLIAQKADLSNVNLMEIPYADVIPGQWYSKYVNYAKIHDLLQTSKENEIFPAEPFTRGRAADTIYRYRNMLAKPTAPTDTTNESSGVKLMPDFALYVSQSYLFAIQYPKLWFYSSIPNLEANAIRTYGFGPDDLEKNLPKIRLELLPDNADFKTNQVYNNNFYYFWESGGGFTWLSAKVEGSSRIYRVSGAPENEEIMLKMLMSITTDIDYLASYNPAESTTTSTTSTSP